MSYSQYTERVLARYSSGMRHYCNLVEQVTEAAIGHDKRALHLGCGHDLSGMLRLMNPTWKVVGVDLDAAAVAAYPGEAYVSDAASMPFGDASFDLVFSEMVLEHLAEPHLVFVEVARVLRPGGRFISVTPNFWSYKSLVAAATPQAFHKFAVRNLRPDSARTDDDVYPTHYSANTKRSINRLARECGLSVLSIDYVDNGPTWFQRFPLVFEVFHAYHSILRINKLAWLRCNIVCILTK